ncbi:MAG: hypothetical protein AAF283_00310 [Cyanobacteria bacterium P01_A01_bin.70]
MVFATEYDPIDQSSPRHDSASLQKSNRSQADRLAPSQYGRPQAASATPEGPASATAAADNVVPLHLNGAAVRVKADPNTRALVLPDKPSLPLGLRLLNRMQQGSTVVTSLLVTGALLIYGSTVYVDKSTNRALSQLDELQGESQQLTSANEAIKQSLAEQAVREESGLELSDPGDVLFLSPLPRRQSAVVPDEDVVEMPRPLGY